MKKNLVRYLFCVIMCSLMVFISDLLNEPEIIFPEIAALVTGAWALEKQPWNVSKGKMLILMSIGSFCGIGIVRYIHIPLYFKYLLAFAIVAFFLCLFKASMVPMISACILPVLLNTSSIIYPVSVIIMTLIIICIEFILEKTGFKQYRQYIKEDFNLLTLKQWLMRILIIGVLIIIPVISQQYFFLAPPLMVIFTELSFVNSKARNHPVKLIIVTSLCSIAGFLAKYFLCDSLSIPITLCAFISILIVYIIFTAANVFFPPAAALCLLPLILNSNKLWLYPIEVTISTIVLAYTAILLIRVFNLLGCDF